MGGRRGRVWRVVTTVLAGALVVPAAAVPAGGAESDWCGALPAGATVWNASVSPVRICAEGVEVPAGSTLVMDASLGPVEVVAKGIGGITGMGRVRTEGATPLAGVVMRLADGGYWVGVALGELS